MLTKSRGLWIDISHYIKNTPLTTPNQFSLWFFGLYVKASNDSFLRDRIIILNEWHIYSSLIVSALIASFFKDAP